MHSEARTTWSNSFARPTLSNRHGFFSFFVVRSLAVEQTTCATNRTSTADLELTQGKTDRNQNSRIKVQIGKKKQRGTGTRALKKKKLLVVVLLESFSSSGLISRLVSPFSCL